MITQTSPQIYFKTLIVAAVCSAFVNSAHAHDENSQGFHANIAAGVMWIDSGNNLNPEHSNKRLDSLQSAPKRKSEFVPLILPELKYSFGVNNQQGVYFNTTPPIEEVGDASLLAGYYYNFDSVGVLDISTFINPFSTAWQNPYLQGEDRLESDVMRFGAKLAFNRILGSGLRLNIVYMRDDVDDDVIGETVSQLDRDGHVVSFNVNHSFYFSKSLEIRPRLSFRQGDYDGESNSYKKFKLDLEARYSFNNWTVIPRIFASCSDYDELHPLFGKTREDKGYGTNLLIGYENFGGWENLALLTHVGIGKSDSNINFFDTKSVSAGIALEHRF